MCARRSNEQVLEQKLDDRVVRENVNCPALIVIVAIAVLQITIPKAAFDYKHEQRFSEHEHGVSNPKPIKNSF